MMEKITRYDIDWLLNLHKKSAKQNEYQVRRLLMWVGLFTALFFGLIILPFFLLIRTSVYLYTALQFHSWLALAGGMFLTTGLIIAYICILFRRVENMRLILKYASISGAVAVTGFCLISLLYLSGVNAKTPEVRDLYRSMHPVLRIAVSTVTLADGDLVITDIERVPAQYRVMGLPENPNSLHFLQESGYVHAVDIRTLGRGTIRNALLRSSFWLMGFKTLRHTGTADHLHVELPVVRY